MHSERFEELAALQALGIPLGADAAEFARHLQDCATCKALVADLTEAAVALSAGAPPVAPPASLKTRILGSLESGLAVSPRSIETREDSLGRRSVDAGAAPRRSVAPWIFAAAAGLLFFLLVTDDARLRREREDLRSQTAALRAEAGGGEELRKESAALKQEKTNLAEKLTAAQRSLARRDLQARVLESDDVQMLFLQGKAPQQRARGRVFWSTRAGRGVVVAGNLSVLPAGKQYELWAFSGGKPVPAGVFDADSAGRVLFESKDLSRIGTPEKFAVTVEPRGGVDAPTGPIVLLGS